MLDPQCLHFVQTDHLVLGLLLIQSFDVDGAFILHEVLQHVEVAGIAHSFRTDSDVLNALVQVVALVRPVVLLGGGGLQLGWLVVSGVVVLVDHLVLALQAFILGVILSQDVQQFGGFRVLGSGD